MRTLRVISRQEDKINTKKNSTRRSNHSPCRGKLSIVGIGPGFLEHLSQKAYTSIENSEIIIGYDAYIKLLGLEKSPQATSNCHCEEPSLTRGDEAISNILSGKEIITSGMTQEVKRVQLAIEKALEGKKVSLISSGDSGVYGMAGLALELLPNKKDFGFDLEIIPGIIAATSSASLLGAPLMHDFCVISLSDLLTDIELIKRRLEMAGRGDFVTVFYNPRSKKRIMPLREAWEILMKHRQPQTPVGIVRNAYRKGQEVNIICLKDLLKAKNIDMLTTIIVGNSRTYVKGRFMITPRGYFSESTKMGQSHFSVKID